MRPTSDLFANMAIAVAAVAVAITAVHGEFYSRNAGGRGQPPREPPTYFRKWNELIGDGVRMDDHRSPVVTLVEFADIECPYCAHLNASVLRPLQRQFGDKLSTVVVHFPLAQHRFALSGAGAVECADLTKHGAAMLSAIYEKQDSIGLKPWSSFATDIGVADTASFARCMTQPPARRIDAGKAWGKAISLRATPTVLVNGWILGTPLDSAYVASAIAAIIAHRRPK